jgi:hypothetical protein
LAIYRLKIELGIVYLIGGRNDLKFDEGPFNLAGCLIVVPLGVHSSQQD